MASKPESSLVDKMMTFLSNNYPGFYFNCHGGMYQMTGLPDIIGIYNGRMIAIEAKMPGKENELTKKQKLVIRRINLYGGVAFMATSVNQIKQKLEEEF